MKRIFIIFLLIILCPGLNAQDYWQQEVNYKISVTLDDEHHTLRGNESFEYINNSPFTLDSILIHIWPNAYLDGETALGKQTYSNKNKILTFGADSLKGCIDSLNFKVDGQTVKWNYTVHRDICIIWLNEPLVSGGKITVSTPFNVKIPSGAISRLGHVGQSYQITQWYPKPAVFDQNGWNAIPYLNQGEFYSEYGSFDVSITLPANYVVGATGDLQTASEIAFMNERFAETQRKLENGEMGQIQKKGIRGTSAFPESSKELKTIRFTQSKVHDFAWFADKRYEVLKGEVELPHSKNKVTTWALFTPNNAGLWKDAIEYLNDGTYYYSLWNGDYPYKQVTAVDGTISAGGGMEYPNITVIGNAASAEELEIVIVHEVGHNWFYGILGSNERVHGWMDEGLNTMNEIRYVQTKYPDNTYMSDMILNGSFHFDHLSHKDLGDFSFRALSRLGMDQPIETPSAEFTPGNYGVVMYQKTGLIFLYLKDYLGDEVFNKCLRNYFDQWKFKHPQPEDMRRSMEATSGKDLSWLFEDLIQTTNHIDYKIQNVQHREGKTIVKLKNAGQVDGPIPVSAIENDSVLVTKWLEPGLKKGQLTFDGTFDKFEIDPDHTISEIDRTNNTYDKSRFFKKLEPIKFNLLTGYNQPGISNNYYLPAVAYNVYDQFMFGMTFHNLSVAPNKFQYLVTPMYSFGRQNVSGIAELSYSFLPKKLIKLGMFGLSLKTFKEYNSSSPQRGVYYSASPYLNLRLGDRKNQGPWDHHLLLLANINTTGFTDNSFTRGGAFVEYTSRFTKPDYNLTAKIRNEYYNHELGRIRIEGTQRYKYMRNKQNKWMELRLSYTNNYYSSLNFNPVDYQISLSGSQGFQDLFFEEYYFGRNRTDGTLGAQRNDDMGNFKTGAVRNFSSYISSANFYMDLPVKPNIFGLFADYGVAGLNGEMNHYFNTGLGIRLGGIFAIYFPLYNSDNLNNFGETMFDNYDQKIRFTLKLNVVNRNFKLSM